MKRTRAMKRLGELFGPPVYTHRDFVSDMLRFAPMTSVDGPPRPTKYALNWRCRLARMLVLELRGVPP